MSQTPSSVPQNLPVPGAPAQPPQGFPPQGVPPQTVLPQGVPPQVDPGTQPPATYPQPGYAQQAAGYPQLAGYPQQAGYPQAGGYQPAGYGYAPQPPAGKSSATLIGIVIGAVALLAIGGGVFLATSGNRAADPPPVTPAPTATAIAAPTTAPVSTEAPPTPAKTTAAPAPTSEAPAPPSDGTAVELGQGVYVAVPEGWEITSQSEGAATVADGEAMVIAQVATGGEAGMDVGQACTAFIDKAFEGVADLKHGKKETLDAGTDAIKVVGCNASYKDTSNGKAMQVYVSNFVSLRVSDGVVAFVTALYSESTPESSFEGVNKILNSVLATQISSD